MELGVYTFAELTSGLGPEERLRNLMAKKALGQRLAFNIATILRLVCKPEALERREAAP